MASKKYLLASVDWLQVQIFELSFEDIARNILGIPEEHFNLENGRLQYYGYDCCYRFGDIRIYDYTYDTQTDKILVLGGKACEWYRKQWLEPLGLTFKQFMKNLLIFEDLIAILRLDICIDDFNQPPFFTPTQLAKICKKRQFVCGKSTVYITYGDEFTGQTLYLKPATADDRIKFYNKAAELAKQQGVREKDLPPQIRTEVVFRREKAQAFFMAYVESDIPLLALFQGYLKGKVKFYSDQHFKVPLKKWIDFLGSSAPFKISIPKQTTELFRKFQWLEKGGSLAIFKALRFLVVNDVFPKGYEVIDYENVKYSFDLANELKKYVVERNRSDLIEMIHDDTKQFSIRKNIKKDDD